MPWYNAPKTLPPFVNNHFSTLTVCLERNLTLTQIWEIPKIASKDQNHREFFSAMLVNQANGLTGGHRRKLVLPVGAPVVKVRLAFVSLSGNIKITNCRKTIWLHIKLECW